MHTQSIYTHLFTCKQEHGKRLIESHSPAHKLRMISQHSSCRANWPALPAFISDTVWDSMQQMQKQYGPRAQEAIEHDFQRKSVMPTYLDRAALWDSTPLRPNSSPLCTGSSLNVIRGGAQFFPHDFPAFFSPHFFPPQFFPAIFSRNFFPQFFPQPSSRQQFWGGMGGAALCICRKSIGRQRLKREGPGWGFVRHGLRLKEGHPPPFGWVVAMGGGRFGGCKAP